jgi:hypothetical protein
MLPTLQFSVRYRAAGFPAGALARSGSLTFTPDDLAHALFVTGRAPGHRASFGAASFWELLHRTSLIPAYVRLRTGGRLVRSRLAVELDRSEKVALSYALGQAMTGLFCERLLSVGHLMHVERYANRYNVVFGPTRRRPDLFGLGPSGWLVAEAKGRSNAMERALEGKLQNQKRAIRTIAGVRPVLALGCVASFPPDTGAMRVDAFDPEDDQDESVDLRIDLDRFFLAYYEPFVAAIGLGNVEARGGRVTTASFANIGLTLGLDNAILNRVRRAMEGQVEGLGAEITDVLQGFVADEPWQQFPDGSVVESDWSESLSVPDWES